MLGDQTQMQTQDRCFGVSIHHRDERGDRKTRKRKKRSR